MNDKRGFTLVELIVVVAVLGVLMAVLVPQYIQYVQKSREERAKFECSQLVKVANVELIKTDISQSASEEAYIVDMKDDASYISSVYEISSAADDSIKALDASALSRSISYAKYLASNEITVYYNGMIYSLDPLYMSEYLRVLPLLNNEDVADKTGKNKTKALQAAAQDEDGNYTPLTEEETTYLKQLADDNGLELRNNYTNQMVFEDLKWVPVASSEGDDVIMVATNSMASNTVGKVPNGYFIYYSGKYFYKAFNNSETGSKEIGGYSQIMDSGALSLKLDELIAGENSLEYSSSNPDQYWRLFENQ